MKKIVSIIVLTASVLLGSMAFAQGNMKDVVYLKNGGMVKGVIIEQVPGQSIKIQTSDGSVFVYQVSEIEKMTKEQVAPQQGYGAMHSTEYRNPTSAWLWSFFITGAGQIYNGQTAKGVGMLLGSMALSSLTYGFLVEGDDDFAALGILTGLGSLALWVWSQVDATSTAKKINMQNGYAWGFENGTTLSFMPEMGYLPHQMSANGTGSLTTGMKLTFSF